MIHEYEQTEVVDQKYSKFAQHVTYFQFKKHSL